MPAVGKSRRNRYRIKRRNSRRRPRKQSGGADMINTIRWANKVKNLYDESISQLSGSYDFSVLKVPFESDIQYPFETLSIYDADLKEIGRTLRQHFQFGKEGMQTPDDFLEAIEAQDEDFINITLVYAYNVEKGIRNLISGETDTKDQIIVIDSDVQAGEEASRYFTDTSNYPFYIWSLMISVDQADPTIPELIPEEVLKKTIQETQIASGTLPKEGIPLPTAESSD